MTLSRQHQEDLLRRGFTRRSFGKIATMLAAGSTLPFYNEFALAQRNAKDTGEVPSDAVMINLNENPMGPCKEALEAAHKCLVNGGRYLFNEAENVANLFSAQEGLKQSYIRIYPGSSAPLHQSVLAFTSPTRPLVMGDPGYESGSAAARFIGAKVIRVPLTKDYAHDVRAMAAADPNAGLIYITNPNNPTGTLTSRADLAWLVGNKPKGSVVMIDEAYTHLSNAPFNSDLVAADKDVIILRTFSKIYGMAGLRAGAVFARPDLLEKLTGFSITGYMPTTGMAAAGASLQVKTLVPERRKIIADIRENVCEYLDKNNFHYVPSVSNCMMIETGKPTAQVIESMRKERVYIGRPWPVWPTHVRISIGTRDEMAKFKVAFSKVMAA